MRALRRLLLSAAGLVMALLLQACGGGGGGVASAGTPLVGPAATVALSLGSSAITSEASTVLTVAVRDASGKPLSGVVVTVATGRTDVGVLSATSLLTDVEGMGQVTLSAARGGVTGADEITASATLGTTTVQGRVGFSVAVSVPTLQLASELSSLRLSAGPVRVTAVVRNAAGQPLSGQIVEFASANGAVSFSARSVVSDASGTAVTTVQPASASTAVADTLIARATVQGRELQSAVNVQVLSESPTISLAILPGNAISASQPVTLQISVREASGAMAANAVVSLSSQFGLVRYSAQNVVTQAGSGIANVTVVPATATASGADVLVASVSLNGVTRSAQQVVNVSPSAVLNSVIRVDLSSTTVTPQTPATASARIVDGAGQPVSGAVVTWATTRGALSRLSSASSLTNANGVATTVVTSALSGTAGADEISATAVVEGTPLQARRGFEVSAAAPTLSVQLQPGGALSVSSGGAQFTATVRDASGQPVVGRTVRFDSVGGLVSFGAPSAVTQSGGIARTTVIPTSPSVAGAETLRATVTVDDRDLAATTSVDLVREQPTLELSFTNSSSSSTATPSRVRAVVRDLRGLPVRDAIVTFSTQRGLGTFDRITAATDINGEAIGVVSPTAGSLGGADLVIATATINAVDIRGTAVAQFSPAASGSTAVGPAPLPTLTMTLDRTSITSAQPALATATLRDAAGQPVAGQVITFTVLRGLGRTNIGTALTNAQGQASVQVSPTSATGGGADEVSASISYAGTALQAASGFQINAVSLGIAFDALTFSSLAEYAQTTLTLNVSGASVGSPVALNVTSTCLAQGKATLSPSSPTVTTPTLSVQYKDSGCGALQASDVVTATVVGSATSTSLTIPLSRPGVASLAFIRADPEVIYLKASGFRESSSVTFEVRDGFGNPLSNQDVTLALLTGAGGVTLEGKTIGTSSTLKSDAQGRVVARVNSGTVPTPVRVQASVSVTSAGVTSTVSTVSSNLSVAVGLPSQLNFSLSQQTRNIEGLNIDGITNTYSVIASDRNGNPVPAGTSINFTAEGGQVEAVRSIQVTNGIARTSAAFVSSQPRPADGRITVVAYALGEESFIDRNGNNTYDAGEPFQDLGNVFKDRNFDGAYDANLDEFVSLTVSNGSACAASGEPTLLSTDSSIPTVPGTCDGVWSGAGRVYVRRAVETVLSTSAGRPLWNSTTGGAGNSGLDNTCRKITLATSPSTSAQFTPVDSNQTWFTNGARDSLSIIVADANSNRLNPMAAGTVVAVSTPTPNLAVALGSGSPVASASEATLASFSVDFSSVTGTAGTRVGVVVVSFTSPSGTTSSVSIRVNEAARATACP